MAVRPRRQRGGPPRYARHFLASAALADALVEEAEIGRDDLVLDLGAGRGKLTAPLARRARRVVAVELEPHAASVLRSAFPAVEVVEGDLLACPLPREPFKVVANLPFHLANDVLRRLLDDPEVPLERADLIVDWRLALKRARVWPSTMRSVVWGARYRFGVSRHLPSGAFRPPPATDAGVLSIVRRPVPLLRRCDHAGFEAFVARGFRRGTRSVATRADLRRLGLAPSVPSRELDLYEWVALYRAVRRLR